MTTDDQEQLGEDIAAVAAWGDPGAVPDPATLTSSTRPLNAAPDPSRVRRRIVLAAAALALIALVTGLALARTGDGADDLRTADGAALEPAGPFVCGNLGAFLQAFGNLGITYDYNPSRSLAELTGLVDRVVRGELVGLREVRSESDAELVFELRASDGERLEFSRSFNPATIAFADLEAAFTPGIPAVVFLSDSARPWGYFVDLEGFFVSCAGDQSPLSVGVAPALWSPPTELDALVVTDEQAAVECVGDNGPTALVGVDSRTGEGRWSRRIGDSLGVTLIDGEIVVEALRHSSRVAVATGDVVSCVGQDPQDRDVAAGPAVSTVPGPKPEDPDTPPLLEVVGSNDRWELQVAPAGEVTQQLQRVVVVERTTGARAWDEVIPGFEIDLLGDLVVSIDQTAGTGSFNVNVEGGFRDTRVTAYSAGSGDQLWRVALPGTPFQAIMADGTIIVPTGTELVALDPATGQTRWRFDVGSPGQGGDYSEPGWIRDLLTDEASGTLIAVVEAQQPYHD